MLYSWLMYGPWHTPWTVSNIGSRRFVRQFNNDKYELSSCVYPSIFDLFDGFHLSIVYQCGLRSIRNPVFEPFTDLFFCLSSSGPDDPSTTRDVIPCPRSRLLYIFGHTTISRKRLSWTTWSVPLPNRIFGLTQRLWISLPLEISPRPEIAFCDLNPKLHNWTTLDPSVPCRPISSGLSTHFYTLTLSLLSDREFYT